MAEEAHPLRPEKHISMRRMNHRRAAENISMWRKKHRRTEAKEKGREEERGAAGAGLLRFSQSSLVCDNGLQRRESDFIGAHTVCSIGGCLFCDWVITTPKSLRKGESGSLSRSTVPVLPDPPILY